MSIGGEDLAVDEERNTKDIAKLEHQLDEVVKVIHERVASKTELEALDRLLQERYATQTKALDAAFVAAEKAVATALESQNVAVAKAEEAAERRFESVNEFRAQLSDQASTFLTRGEYTVAHNALVDKLDTEVKRTGDRFQEYERRNETIVKELESRLTAQISSLISSRDVGTGQSTGSTQSMARINDVWRTVGTVGSMVVAIVAIIVVVLLH